MDNKTFLTLKNKYLDDIIFNNNNNNTGGNTSNIFNIIIKNIQYICKFNKYFNIKSIDMVFENEIFFYINLSNIVNKIIYIPNYFDSCNIIDTKYIIIEKLQILENNNIDLLYNIIDSIIKLHIFFWNKEIKFLNYDNNTDNIIFQIKKEQNQYLDIINEYFDELLFINLKNIFLNENNNFSKNSTNKTFIHGSLKVENICKKYINDDLLIYFIDWTYFRKGYGIDDILYLLIFSLDNLNFKIHYNTLIIYYFNEINKHIKYNIEDFYLNIKESLNEFILVSIFGLLIINKLKYKIIKLDFLKNYFYILSTIK